MVLFCFFGFLKAQAGPELFFNFVVAGVVMAAPVVLILEYNASLSEVISEALKAKGIGATIASSSEKALKILEKDKFDLILVNLSAPKLSGLELLKLLVSKHSSTPILPMSSEADTELIVKSIQLGAIDFIKMPFPTIDLVEKVEEHTKRNEEASSKDFQLIAQSDKMKQVLFLANKVSKFNTPVLLTGESGSGKEVLANYIHLHSRPNSPFVGINCASISKSLFESEFFGHEAGAFTGAAHAKEGFFESAHSGTLFLDEISELSSSSQAKLLRAIQEGKNRRVGGLKSKDIDVRIISASNMSLENLVKKKEFRDDLFYRIGVFSIEIPPLRERREDIVPIAKCFMLKQAEELDIKNPFLNKGAIECLEGYEWPGNVRELENTIERAMIMSKGDIQKEHLQLGTKKSLDTALASLNLSALAESAKRNAETKAILEALSQESGNKAKSAERLGVSYKTLLSKIKDYGLGT